MRQQRSGLPLMIIALVLFLLAALAALIWFDPFNLDMFGLSRAATRPEVPVAVEPPPEEPQEESAPEPVVEPAPEPEPEPEVTQEPQQQQQTVVPERRYVVSRRDTLSDLSRQFWGDPNLWPLIYEENEPTVVDPDFLSPGQQLFIPEWIEPGTPIEGDRLRAISEAHIAAHQLYAALGDDAIGLGAGQPQWWLDRLGRERANKALWVLYSGLRYNPDLLDDYLSVIDPTAARQVRNYIERFGYPPRR